jgi:hypothetical protein
MAAKVTSDPVPLSCDTLGDQDSGIARMLIDAAINEAVKDLMDRAHEDGKPRNVCIQLDLVLHDGLVISNVQAAAKIPPRRSKSTLMKPRMTRKDHTDLFFQPHNGENPDQPTFNDGETN